MAILSDATVINRVMCTIHNDVGISFRMLCIVERREVVMVYKPLRASTNKFMYQHEDGIEMHEHFLHKKSKLFIHPQDDQNS